MLMHNTFLKNSKNNSGLKKPQALEALELSKGAQTIVARLQNDYINIKTSLFLHKFCLRTYFHQPLKHYVLLTFTPLMLVVLGGTSWSFWKRGSGPNNLIMTVSVSVFLKKFCITTRKCVTNILQLL